MTMTTTEWIGVEQVAAELSLTQREAWELVRRIGVPLLESGRGRMTRVRFRRADWEDRRDAACKPPEPRRGITPSPATKPAAKLKPQSKEDILAKLRKA